MTRNELFELLDTLELEHNLRYEVSEGFEGIQYIMFKIEEENEDDHTR